MCSKDPAVHRGAGSKLPTPAAPSKPSRTTTEISLRTSFSEELPVEMLRPHLV